MGYVEQAPSIIWQMTVRRLLCWSPQCFTALAGSVVYMQYKIGQSVGIEEIVFRRQLDAPAAHCTQILERQIAFIGN
jgi:hypothetical protein